jgi:hypothetical protein
VGAAGVAFTGDTLFLSLTDGRVLQVPLSRVPWLAWLQAATPEQRAHWSAEPGGFAVHWDDLDDGVEVRHLLALTPLA